MALLNSISTSPNLRSHNVRMVNGKPVVEFKNQSFLNDYYPNKPTPAKNNLSAKKSFGGTSKNKSSSGSGAQLVRTKGPSGLSPVRQPQILVIDPVDDRQTLVSTKDEKEISLKEAIEKGIINSSGPDDSSIRYTTTSKPSPNGGNGSPATAGVSAPKKVFEAIKAHPQIALAIVAAAGAGAYYYTKFGSKGGK